jgi:hypothetical protein
MATTDFGDVGGNRIPSKWPLVRETRRAPPQRHAERTYDVSEPPTFFFEHSDLEPGVRRGWFTGAPRSPFSTCSAPIAKQSLSIGNWDSRCVVRCISLCSAEATAV